MEYVLCAPETGPIMTTAAHPADVYRGYRFPGAVIAHAVWLYLRFPLRFRDVEELLAERGIQVSYETVHCWAAKFGPQAASQLRKREGRPGRVWHLDGRAVRIGGKQHWLWRAVDEHGATLDVLLQEQRDTDAAERFFQVLLGHAGAAPEWINTDKLGSYAAAIRQLPKLAEVGHRQVRAAQRCNNKVEQAHQPTRVREIRMGRLRCPTSTQRFLSAFTRTWNLFRRRRRAFTAPAHGIVLQERFTGWQVAAESRLSYARERSAPPQVRLSPPLASSR